jgi:hypothetical protein
MLAKRLALLVVPVLFLVSVAGAQDTSNLKERNELSFTAGRTFVSTQTVPSTGLPLHFGNPLTLGGDYAHLIKHHGIFGLYAEVPVSFCPKMNLNYRYNLIPANYKSLFVTPSVRLNIFSGQGFTPWVSAGGGYGRFFESSNLIWGTPNLGPSATNTFAVQFGAGLDAWFWHRFGARLEVRDYYSGVPDLSAVPSEPVSTGRSRQHNYYVGVGVVHRF